MSELVSLEQARQEANKNLGQQSKPGFRQKTKAQLLREQMQLEAASREQGRLQAMARWYAASETVVMDLYNVVGFPMHKDANEKVTQMVAAFLRLTARIVANDKSDAEPLVDAFRALCKQEKERIEALELSERHQKMASVVAALIEDPALAKTEGVPSPLAALDEPWRGFAELLNGESQDRKDREDAAFTYLKDVKLFGEELAVTYLRGAVDQMRSFVPDDRLAGWKAMIPELLREKTAREAPKEPVPEANVAPISVDAPAEIEEEEEEPDEADARHDGVVPA